MSQNVLVIGICGVTCGGKTTISNKLNKILPFSTIVSQDDYFLDVDDPRHTWIESLNHINFDILSSLDMDRMNLDVENLLKEKTVVKAQGVKSNLNITLDSDLYKMTYNKLKETKTEIVIIEGFSIFNFKPLLDKFSLKYYCLLTKEECLKRRSQRVYDPPDCSGYFEECVWPEHLSQLKEVREQIKDVTYFDEHTEDPCAYILQDILNYLHL